MLPVLEVKPEAPIGEQVVDVEGSSSDEPKKKGPTSVAMRTSSPLLPLSCYAQATHAALAFLGALLVFELHLQEEYECFHWDQMQRIQDLRRERDATFQIMYTRLVRFK